MIGVGLEELRGCAWHLRAACELLDFLYGGFQAATGEGGEFLADANVLRGDGQEPSFRGVAKHVTGQSQQGRRTGRVSNWTSSGASTAASTKTATRA